jgi:predicted nucleic acid-binding protein
VQVFIDANIVIYLIEVVSDLVRMECRVGPLSSGDVRTLADFDSFFGSHEVVVLPVTAAICDRAAAIRAAHRFRPLDSLHLAAAVEQGCDRFLTHDQRLNRFPDIGSEVL